MEEGAVKAIAAVKKLRQFEKSGGDKVDLKSSGKAIKKGATIVIGILVLGFMLLIYLANVLSPINLLHQLGDAIVTTATTLFEKAKHVFVELLGLGEVPDDTTEALKAQGIEVGAVSSTGAFIETNRVIASGTDYLIAASDGSSFKVANGTLSVRFKGKVISAGEIESELATNNEFFEAFYTAINNRIDDYDKTSANSAKKAVNEELGITGTEYDDLPYTGDHNVDQAAFEAKFADIVNGNKATTSIGTGYQAEYSFEYEGETQTGVTMQYGANNTAGQQAESYIKKIAEETSGDSEAEATEKAAALINAAVSSNEPYYAARAYSGIANAIALDADKETSGPINEAMNLLTRETTSNTFNPETGAAIPVTGSAILSPNVRAVTTGDDFSADTAAGYSRDRTMVAASVLNSATYGCLGDTSIDAATNDTVVSINNLVEGIWRWIVSIFGGDPKKKANAEVLVKSTKDSVEEALFTDPSEAMTGQTLGERLIQGAAYFNVAEAREIGGSTASDKAAIAAYTDMTQAVIARKAEADRATKSPFDASSPYTFLGTIVTSLQSIASSNSIASVVSSTNNLAGKSLAALTTGAYADAAKETFQRINGDDCTTENSIGGEGDMYCNEAPSFDPNTFSMTLSELENKISDSLDGNGHIMDNTPAARYAILHTERKSTPGVKDANVCAADQSASLIQKSFLQSLWDSIFGTSEVATACSQTAQDVATGKEYANTGDNDNWNSEYKFQQGYFLETYVLDIFGYYGDDPCHDNPVAAYKKSYYERNPLDNSPEGVLARRTGLEKSEVIAGIKAIQYLAYLHNYDPSTRLSFLGVTESKPPHFKTNTTLAADYIIDDNRRLALFRLWFDKV